MAKTKKSTNGKTKRPYVVIRTYSAGVHVGELVSLDGKEVTLSNARRVWKWCGAYTLNEIAVSGVGAGSKISVEAPSITLTEAIEVIHCTEAAEANLRAAQWTP